MARPDSFDAGFARWVADALAPYAASPPDLKAAPCFAADGRPKARGPWDVGPAFARSAETTRFLGHQAAVRAFLTEDAPQRGVLLFGALGSGKTATAIAVSEALRGRQVVVLTPAALRDNFQAELLKFGVADQARYRFVAYDGAPVAALAKLQGLDHKLLIVDEVHNLVSMVANESQRGAALYRAIMGAADLKVLLLSGTPLINDPFELAILANMLAGYFTSKGARVPVPADVPDKKLVPLFRSRDEFWYHFLDERADLKNRIALQRRLSGLISYYGGLQPRDQILPRVREHWVTVPMSAHQFLVYDRARSLEREGERRVRDQLRRGNGAGKRKMVDLTLMFSAAASDAKLSNFRAFSRQFCNLVFPPGVPRYVPRVGDINAERLVAPKSAALASSDNGVDADEPGDDQRNAASMAELDAGAQRYLVEELAEHSPKYAALLARLRAAPGPAYVYSQFRTTEGVNALALVLKAHGFIEYGHGDPFFRKPPMSPAPHTRDAVTGRRWDACTPAQRAAFRPLAYMFWPKSGGAAVQARRDHLLGVFNAEANRRGHAIAVFLSTKAGAEGLNLMNVRQVHIVEPYWNEMRIKQAVGRATRLCSHATLPPQDRVVDVYRYVATTEGHDNEEDGGLSTDEFVRDVAARKQKAIEQAQDVMKAAAFDCRINLAHNALDTPGLRCFEPPPGLDTHVAMDLSQEPTDKQVLGDRRTVAVSLRPVTLRNGDAYRVRTDDEGVLRRFAAGGFAPGERAEVPLYHRAVDQVAATLLLVAGRPPAVQPT